MLGHHAVSEAPVGALVDAGVLVLYQAEETDLAQAVGKLKTRSIAQAAETDVAHAIGRHKAHAIGQVAETDFAQPMAFVKSWPLVLPSIQSVYAPRPLITLTIAAATVRYSTETFETP